MRLLLFLLAPNTYSSTGLDIGRLNSNSAARKSKQGFRLLPISTRRKKPGWTFRMPYNRREVNGISGLCIYFEYYVCRSRLYKVYNLRPYFLVKFALNFSIKTRLQTSTCSVDAFNAFWTTGNESRFHSLSTAWEICGCHRKSPPRAVKQPHIIETNLT
jgi:hypothetical protein